VGPQRYAVEYAQVTATSRSRNGPVPAQGMGNPEVGQRSVNRCLLELPQSREYPGQPMVADGGETAGDLRGEQGAILPSHALQRSRRLS